MKEAGGTLIVSPNCDPHVIATTKTARMQSYPGVMTPTECFAALAAGADGLKFFPASLIGPDGVKAIRAVLPKDTQVYAVGGAGPSNFADLERGGGGRLRHRHRALHARTVGGRGDGARDRIWSRAYDEAFP